MDTQIFWPDMLLRWHELPRAVQFRTAYRIGRTLHTLWQSGVILQDLPLELTVFIPGRGCWHWQVPMPICPRGGRILSIEALRRCLRDWHGHLGHPLSNPAGELLLRGLLRPEGLDRDSIRLIARECAVERCAHVKDRPGRLYRQALRMRLGEKEGIYQGYWACDARLSPALLATAVAQVERDERAPLLKSTPKTKLRRAPLLGREVMIKQFDLPTWRHRLQAVFRYSRGRRAWAAGKAMADLDIPTPTPLGYLEIRGRWFPIRSYVFTEFQADAFDLRAWLKLHRTAISPAHRTWAEAQIEDRLLRLYAARIYHSDTKLSNLLALPAAQPDEQPWSELMWIDLESIRFNRRPTRYRVIRNLVQLNGSIRDRWMARRDRIQFLMRMARHFPWLNSSRTIQHITRWTQRRWRRERDKLCGP